MAMTRIMVVDDSPTDLAFMGNLLKKNGYDVILANGGEAAIQRAAMLQPDLILMDLVMPGVNGFQATRVIAGAETTKHIPIIICTSKNQETDRIWGMRQGAKAYVSKPVLESEIIAKIELLAGIKRVA
jgi:twitching motility two-component system response regulator PilH